MSGSCFNKFNQVFNFLQFVRANSLCCKHFCFKSKSKFGLILVVKCLYYGTSYGLEYLSKETFSHQFVNDLIDILSNFSFESVFTFQAFFYFYFEETLPPQKRLKHLSEALSQAAMYINPISLFQVIYFYPFLIWRFSYKLVLVLMQGGASFIKYQLTSVLNITFL